MFYVETLFDKYPDIPEQTILKSEALRLGVRFSDSVLEITGKEAVTATRYDVFSYDLAEVEKQKRVRVPYDFRLKDGVVVQTRLNPKSPFVIDLIDDKFMFCERNQPLVEVEFHPRPRYFDKTFDDGTLMSEAAVLMDWCVIAASCVLRVCQLWENHEQCKYCDMNANTRLQLKLGRKFPIVKDPERVARAVEEAFKYSEKEGKGRNFLITGGAITRKVRGMGDTDFYCQYVKAVRERVGEECNVLLQTIAKGEDDLTKLRDAGVTVHDANIEVWDPKLFNIICPGKARYCKRDEWIRRVVKSVEVFGVGNVCPGFVAGVEMAKPWGFKTAKEAVKSTLSGFDYLMTHGVIPRMDHWCIEPGSLLAAQEPPPAEYYIEVSRGWHDLLKKYGLPPLTGRGDAGYGRATYNIATMLDH